eukprot:TRINITY_DN33561_c0_g1_i1.p1 TRINITY_DN33561_c0_g1~~TRINITY_DN33561_c0_g1_i1.p1  ORF type:complete len:455 (+),score=-15.29 TRINITY_DN33561_c0_g1_i1:96-1460(+)
MPLPRVTSRLPSLDSCPPWREPSFGREIVSPEPRVTGGHHNWTSDRMHQTASLATVSITVSAVFVLLQRPDYETRYNVGLALCLCVCAVVAGLTVGLPSNPRGVCGSRIPDVLFKFTVSGLLVYGLVLVVLCVQTPGDAVAATSFVTGPTAVDISNFSTHNASVYKQAYKPFPCDVKYALAQVLKWAAVTVATGDVHVALGTAVVSEAAERVLQSAVPQFGRSMVLRLLDVCVLSAIGVWLGSHCMRLLSVAPVDWMKASTPQMMWLHQHPARADFLLLSSEPAQYSSDAGGRRYTALDTVERVVEVGGVVVTSAASLIAPVALSQAVLGADLVVFLVMRQVVGIVIQTYAVREWWHCCESHSSTVASSPVACISTLVVVLECVLARRLLYSTAPPMEGSISAALERVWVCVCVWAAVHTATRADQIGNRGLAVILGGLFWAAVLTVLRVLVMQ